MENSQHISLVIHYRGRIERGANELLSYVDGEISIIDWVNVDWLSKFLIKDIPKKIGYPKVCEIHWLEPSMGLDDGLRLLKFDRDVVSMYEATHLNENEVQLFIEHPVSVPCLVTKGDEAAGGSNPGQNITTKKGRTKVCARKTPTPKKSYGPKRALLRDEGTDKEGDACDPNVNTPAIEGSIDVVATDQFHEHPNLEPIFFSQPPQTPIQPPEHHEANPTQPIFAESVVSKTNLTPSNYSDVHSVGVESTIPQGPSRRSSESTPNAQSVDTSSADFLTQYVPIPQNGPFSQSSTDSHPTPPSVTVNEPTNENTNTQEDVPGTKKKKKKRSTKRPPPTGQTFVPNPDPSKPPSVYVPVDAEEFSDEDAGYHCYESEELHSIARDDDNQPPVFPQGNPDAHVREVQLELEMEFETIRAFQKAVRKFNIHLGRNVFFPRVDSERCKAICYAETCPWEIYCAKRSFPPSF